MRLFLRANAKPGPGVMRLKMTFCINFSARHLRLVHRAAYLCHPNPQGSLGNASLAQLVEQLIRNEQVVGSSPIRGSPKSPPRRSDRAGFFYGCYAGFSAAASLHSARLRPPAARLGSSATAGKTRPACGPSGCGGSGRPGGPTESRIPPRPAHPIPSACC